MEQKPEVKSVSLKACTILFQLFGLQYFSFSTRSLLLPTAKLLLHKIVLCCMLLYVLIELIFIGIVINIENKLEAAKNSTRTRTGFLVHYGSYCYITFVVLVSTLHAWFNSVKSMKIFNQLERIQKIFESETGCAPKYDEFIKRFKSVTVIFVTVFLLMTSCTLGFIFYHNRSTIFYWALLVVPNYFFFGVTFLRICFLMEILNVNLQSVQDVLKKVLSLKQIIKVVELSVAVSVGREPENETIYNSIVVLKRIYGLLYELSVWINETIGVALIFELLSIIISSTSAGYKFYSVFSGHMVIGRLGTPIYTMLFFYGILGMIVVYACSCYETVTC